MGNNGDVLSGRFPIRVSLALSIVLVVIAVTVVAIEPLHGSILITVVPDHGLDTGDLIVVPLLVGAGWLIGSRFPSSKSTDGLASTRRAWSALSLGATLALIGSLRLADVTQRTSPLTALLGLVLAFTALWFLVESLLSPAPLLDGLAGHGWILAVVLVGGSLIDVLFVPSGTVFGVAAFALALAWMVRSRQIAAVFVVLAVTFVVLNTASLSDIAGVDVVMSGDGGGAARAAALGVVLIVLGAASLWTEPRHG